jgi:hypothetical protein
MFAVDVGRHFNICACLAGDYATCSLSTVAA